MILLFLIIIGGSALVVSGLWIIPVYFFTAFFLVPLALLAVFYVFDIITARIRHILTSK